MSTVKRGRGRPRRDAGPAIDLNTLLDAALHAFATNGYSATSIREISREIGVSHSLAHHYFDTKDVLWKACVDRCFGSLHEEMSVIVNEAMQLQDMQAASRMMIENYVVLSERFPDGILVLLQEAGRGGPRLDYIMENYFSDFMRLINRYYQGVIDTKTVRPIPWQTLFSVILLGGPARYALAPLTQVLDGEEGGTIDSQAHAKHVADLVLNGLLPPTS